jgi:hypothetical protein
MKNVTAMLIVDEIGRQSAPNCFEAFSQRHGPGALSVKLFEGSLCLVFTLSRPYLLLLQM